MVTVITFFAATFIAALVILGIESAVSSILAELSARKVARGIVFGSSTWGSDYFIALDSGYSAQAWRVNRYLAKIR